MIIQSTIAFVLTIGVLVVVHEWGHFIASKLLGIRVEEFAVGFGPKIWTVAKRGDTEYTIRAVPLGGFNRLSGMEPGEGENDPMGYNAQPIWKRFVVVFAGPLMSFVLAFVIFCAMGATIGLPSDIQNKIDKNGIAKDSPAQKAGLRENDRIIAIDGVRIRNGVELREIVGKSAGKRLALHIRRGARVFVVRATPVLKVSEGEKKGLLGVVLAHSLEKKHYGFAGSISRGAQLTWVMTQDIIDTFTHVSKLEKNVGGIVAIARATAQATEAGFYVVVLQGAGLSFMLAILNLIPWPILDGGHILLLGLEGIRRRKLTVEQTQVFQTVGLVSLIALALLLVYVDVSRWISGTPLGQ